MIKWIVTYRFRGSRYFDSPLRWREARMSFDTYAEARKWADAEHPDIEEFEVLGIHKEEPIIDHGSGAMNYYSAERYWASDGNDFYGRHY